MLYITMQGRHAKNEASQKAEGAKLPNMQWLAGAASKVLGFGRAVANDEVQRALCSPRI